MTSRLPENRDLQFRAHLLLYILLTLEGLVLGVMLYLAFVAEIQMDEAARHRSLAFLSAIEITLVCLSIGLLQGAYRVANSGAVLITTLAVSIAVACTTGVPSSPVLAMVLVPPVVAFCLLGVRLGSALATLIVLAMTIQWVGTTQWGWQLPALQSPKNPDLDRLLCTMVSFFMVIAVLVVYECANARLRYQRDREREQLQHLASHDELTGLANRRHFHERLTQACARSDRNGQQIAVLLIDLDGFKKINDAFGHAAGDTMLAEIAARLRGIIRRQDLVARLGGDEYAVIVDPASRDEIRHLCERVHHLIAQPFESAQQTHQVGASIGVALYPSDGRDAHQILRVADAAMYAAKKRLGNRTAESDCA